VIRNHYDKSGGAVPGAKVKLTNQAPSLEQAATNKATVPFLFINVRARIL